MSEAALDPSHPDHGTFLDPRIKEELERLNTSSAEINRLEKQLDESRQQFRQTLTESSHTLNEQIKKCRRSAGKAQGYYLAREEARKAQEKAQEAALRYQRAAGLYSAAKETIAIAEEAAITTSAVQSDKKRQFDSALQEMLNLSTSKLNAAENEKRESQREHEERSKHYISTQQKVDLLAKKFKRNIAKSAAYYDLKKSFHLELNDLKTRIEALQTTLHDSKEGYRRALKNLEQISEDIHQSRQVAAILAESRQSGVGADSNTDSEAEPEKMDIMFQIDESLDGESVSTDQDSLRSDVASLSSPPPTSPPPSSGRSISGSSHPSQDEFNNRRRGSAPAGVFNFEATSRNDQAKSTIKKYEEILDENEDDDDEDYDVDDDIFVGAETDDELDESDDEGLLNVNRDSGRKLRTISVGDLSSFSVYDNGDDIEIDGHKSPTVDSSKRTTDVSSNHPQIPDSKVPAITVSAPASDVAVVSVAASQSQSTARIAGKAVKAAPSAAPSAAQNAAVSSASTTRSTAKNKASTEAADEVIWI